MGFHTFDTDRADELEDPARYRFCSHEELLTHLGVGPDAVVADLGSGTGFYTDAVAPVVGHVHAVDVQPAMHDRYREKGVPENVSTVTAGVDALPFDDDALDAAFSTMTYHEFATSEALEEVTRVLRPGGRLVTVDWSGNGAGEDGPPLDERYTLGDCVSALGDAGVRVVHATERRETYVCVGVVA